MPPLTHIAARGGGLPFFHYWYRCITQPALTWTEWAAEPQRSRNHRQTFSLSFTVKGKRPKKNTFWYWHSLNRSWWVLRFSWDPHDAKLNSTKEPWLYRRATPLLIELCDSYTPQQRYGLASQVIHPAGDLILAACKINLVSVTTRSLSPSVSDEWKSPLKH